MAKKKFMTVRTQMAIAGVGLWLLLACWTVSAFWDHIGGLKLDTQFGAKCGAMAGEFALLCLVLWHCYNKHIGVRKWSLILGFILSAFLLIHAGALYGMKEAKQEASETQEKLTKALGDLSAQQSQTLGQTSSRHNAVTVAKQQGELSRNAQGLVADGIIKSSESVKESSILPMWYLNGWMYSALFIASLLMVCIIVGLMTNSEDIDEDFDGIPDKEQREYEALHAGHWGEFEDQQDGTRRRRWIFTNPDHPSYQKSVDDEFPSSLDASERQVKRSSALRQSRQTDRKSATDTATVATVAHLSELETLRGHLREIALDHPKKWFRADLIKGGVLIRMFTREQGREVAIAETRQSDKLLRAVNRPDFRPRLVDELIRQGFPIEGETAA